MITRLTVKNFALLKDAEISFESGFTAITGETGAGKSLLVQALEFLGGGRADADLIRDGAKNAVVEGEFTSSNDVTLILRRELNLNGRSRSFLDDSPVSLKELSSQAVLNFDITSQRAFSRLLNPEIHLDLLDSFAGLQESRNRLEEFQRQRSALQRRLAELRRKRDDFQRQQDFIAFQLKQIDALDPQPGEEEELRSEARLLENSEEIRADGARIIDRLWKDAESADAIFNEAGRLLEKLEGYDAALTGLCDELETARITAREIARQIENRTQRLSFNPSRLEEVRERLHALAGLARKYGGTFQAMLELRDSLRIQLSGGESADREIQELEDQSSRLTADWIHLAEKVSAIRRQRVSELSGLVQASLARLGIPEAVFIIDLIRRPDEKGLYEVEGKRWALDERGIETAEFSFSANPGLAPRPLAQVASGGELSRVNLALKEVLPSPTLETAVILDEIDAGVSGKVAHLVAQKLRTLAAGRQIIAITHLPQIAAQADHHIRVSKSGAEGETFTIAEALDLESRIDEIAAMLSGGDLTPAARDQARNLMGRPSKISQTTPLKITASVLR